MSGETSRPEQGTARSGDGPMLRWQALFQRAQEAVFVLNRRRRILFVNRAWESLTGLTAVEARGLACLRRPPLPADPRDVVVRSLCAPPPEVLQGQVSRTRRLVPRGIGGPSWWTIEFLPLQDADGVLCVIGRIQVDTSTAAAPATPLPERLVALRDKVMQRYSLDQLAGAAPVVERLREQARLASTLACPVLLQGEPGSGKQWLARAIHCLGPRRAGPFIALDCPRLPATLLARVLVQAPAQATIYLREPAHLPQEAQSYLSARLRETAAGPRILAGVSHDLTMDVRAGRLQEDLQNLLGLFVISVPALRDRRIDWPGFVSPLLARLRPGQTVTAAAWELLRAYSWPENFRELERVVRNASARAGTAPLDVGHFPSAVRLAVHLEETPATQERPLPPLDQVLEKVERRLIELALRKARGNRSQAADLLSIWRARLLRRMEALGIDASPAPGDGEAAASAP